MSTGNDFLEKNRARRRRSLTMRQRARSSMGGGVGHDLRHFEPVPLSVERREGGRVWDVDGNQHIDFLMRNGAPVPGHAPEEVVEAVSSTVGRGTHFGSDHPLQIEWAERIYSMVPSVDRVRFVNSGTEATLCGLPEIAAIILEPSGASWGRVPIAPNFLKGPRRIAAGREVLLIFDAVVAGFRFSPVGAQELYGVQPDLSCFARIMAGGLPGEALAARADSMRRFDIHGPSPTREDLHTTEGRSLQGLPGGLITRYQQLLRHHDVDVMSFTGGSVSAAHTERDIEQAAIAFEHTVVALRDEGHISCL